MSHTCQNCVFFTDPQDGIGECRRYPPTVIDHKHDRYPFVDGEKNWCGEYESFEDVGDAHEN